MAESGELTGDKEFSLDDIVTSPNKNDSESSSTSSSKETQSNSAGSNFQGDKKYDMASTQSSNQISTSSGSKMTLSEKFSPGSAMNNQSKKKHRGSVRVGKNSTRYIRDKR